MKNKITFLILSCFLTVALQAQIEITAEDLPSVGTAYALSFLNTPDIDVGDASDTEQIWDFSNLEANDTSFVFFQNSFDAPGGDDFPLADMARTGNLTQLLGFALGDVLPGGGLDLQGTVHYGINGGSGNIYSLGILADIDAGGFLEGPLALEATSPDLYLAPLEFGETEEHEGAYAFTVDIDLLPVPITITIDVERELTADAFGQLYLPTDTFDVLRYQENANISISIPLLFDTTVLAQNYRFMSNDLQYPVASTYGFAGDKSYTAQSMEYYNTPGASVAEFAYDNECLTVDFINESEFAINFEWDFGDGETSTGLNPSHTYDDEGTYTVTLTATNFEGTDTVSITSDVVVECPASAAFGSFSECLTATFFNQSENGESYLWDFGDGNTSEDEDPVYTYGDAGTYEVSLTVFGITGDEATYSEEVDVECVVEAAFESNSECVTVTFFNQSVNAESYNWNFGDETTSTDEEPVHTYENPGTYTVTLTADGITGDEAIYEAEVVVTCPFTADFDVFADCENYTFVNESGNIDSYSWDFGDGNTGTGATPTHTYTEEGPMTVILTVTSSFGETATSEETIDVSDCNPDTAIEDAEQWGGQLMPNPTSDVCQITFPSAVEEGVALNITSLNGQLVYSELIPRNSTVWTLSLSDLAEGAYLIQLNTTDASFTNKLIITK